MSIKENIKSYAAESAGSRAVIRGDALFLSDEVADEILTLVDTAR